MTLFSCYGEVFVMARILTHFRRLKDGCLEALSSRFARWTKPLASSLPLQTLADLGRSKSELLAENALLRQQLIILRRQVKRPPITRTERVLLVLLARLVRTWKQALIIVQPDTLVLATWVIHSKNRHLETEKDSLRWFANIGGLM